MHIIIDVLQLLCLIWIGARLNATDSLLIMWRDQWLGYISELEDERRANP